MGGEKKEQEEEKKGEERKGEEREKVGQRREEERRGKETREEESRGHEKVYWLGQTGLSYGYNSKPQGGWGLVTLSWIHDRMSNGLSFVQGLSR